MFATGGLPDTRFPTDHERAASTSPCSGDQPLERLPLGSPAQKMHRRRSRSRPVEAAGDVAYHAAKADVVGPTRATAIDMAAAGITVNAVAPGWMDTASASGHERRMGAGTPVGRSGTADEVAHAIAFLAGEGASYITGQLITVDGAKSVSEERH